MNKSFRCLLEEWGRLRSRVKAELGSRDARLRLFGIKPL